MFYIEYISTRYISIAVRLWLPSLSFVVAEIWFLSGSILVGRRCLNSHRITRHKTVKNALKNGDDLESRKKKSDGRSNLASRI